MCPLLRLHFHDLGHNDPSLQPPPPPPPPLLQHQPRAPRALRPQSHLQWRHTGLLPQVTKQTRGKRAANTSSNMFDLKTFNSQGMQYAWTFIRPPKKNLNCVLRDERTDCDKFLIYLQVGKLNQHFLMVWLCWEPSSSSSSWTASPSLSRAEERAPVQMLVTIDVKATRLLSAPPTPGGCLWSSWCRWWW